MARPTIDPEAFDSLIAEGFIRQSDLIKAIQKSLTGVGDLESLLIDNYRIPKGELGKALGSFFGCAYVPFDDRTVADPELLKILLDFVQASGSDHRRAHR